MLNIGPDNHPGPAIGLPLIEISSCYESEHKNNTATAANKTVILKAGIHQTW